MVSKIAKWLLNFLPRELLIKLSLKIKPLIGWFFKGTRYKDPINNKTYRTFLPYGYINPRPNVLSPGTFSLERHRLLWLYLEQKTTFFNPKNNLNVLHVAPEQAFYKRFKKQKNLNYTTTDLHSPLADVKADICELPFSDNTFDFIFCNHVLEHVIDDTKAMKELFRVLKPNGTGIFQVPQNLTLDKTFEDPSITDPKERERLFGQYDHLRVYGKDYFDRLRSVGFKVNEIDYTSRFSQEKINYYRLSKGEIIPVCTK